jgi:glycosyltransferase involved in cell wall biosynthesis
MNVNSVKPNSSISYIMPVLNEEAHLRSAVASIFEQHGLVAGNAEVILALGPSKDKTNEIAEALSKEYPVQLVSNPTGKTPAGLNLAIAKAKNDVVIRVDAHSVLSPDYSINAVKILSETGAGNVGGIMKAEGVTPFQKAVAWAYGSRFGLGGGTYHVGGEAGPSDSVYLGVFRRDVLLKLGGFNEKMIRGQDWELNLRIRESGEQVWFDPSLVVTYFPRSTWRKLLKQFFDTGAWRALLTKSHPNKANLRYFAPPALVLASFIGLILAIGGFGGLIGLLPVVTYLAAVTLISLTAKGLSLKAKLALLITLPTMHFSWGTGFMAGLFLKR